MIFISGDALVVQVLYFLNMTSQTATPAECCYKRNAVL